MAPHTRGKKRTVSDVINEELNVHAQQRTAPDDDEAQPAIDNVAALDTIHAPTRKARRPERLRARAPLDESFSSGKYQMEALSTEDVESKLDDIFGILDETVEDDEARGAKTEEELDQWWEERRKSEKSKKTARTVSVRRLVVKPPKQEGDAAGNAEDVAALGIDAVAVEDAKTLTNDDDLDVLAQIGALRKRQVEVTVGSDGPIGSDGPASKGPISQDFRSQSRQVVASIGQLIALRMKMQPCVSRATRLPQYYAFPSYLAAAKPAAAHMAQATRDLRATIGELITTDHGDALGNSSQVWQALEAYHAGMIADVDSYLASPAAQFGGSPGGSSGSQLKALNQPLLSQIRGVISGKARLLNRAQRNRSHLSIFGHPHHMLQNNAAARAQQVADGDVDDEIFDDGDFLRELAQKYGHQAVLSAHGNSSAVVTASLDEMKKQEEALRQSGPNSRHGMHKKTKGRTISMDPRPKLVGFMVPVPYVYQPAQQDALFSSVLR